MKVSNPQAVAGAASIVNLAYNGTPLYNVFASTDSGGYAYFWYGDARGGKYTAMVLYLWHNALTWNKTQGVTSATFYR